jgi:uncharacterized protein YecE (DUF72 family)
MDFGRVSDDEINSIDFSLPAESLRNKRVLAKSKENITGKTQVYIGCAKWSRKDWIGKIYPKGAKDGDFLSYYSKQFNCVELNATFHQMPNRAQLGHWKNMVGADFLFCPKFTDIISHRKRLANASKETNEFLLTIDVFEENLGPTFLQLPPNFPPKNFDLLENYLRTLPRSLPIHVELRHPQWYEHPHLEKVLDLFEELGVGSIITDASGRRDCAHMQLTNNSAFIRFVGNSLHPTDYKRINAWVQRMKHWIDEGLQNIYFFMHQHEELHSPELCAYTIKEMNKQAQLHIKEPVFVNEQRSLGLF